jgi:hypothetical protein
VLRYLAIGLGAVVLISILGVWLFRRAGGAEAVRDAKDQTHLAADGSIEPVLSDADWASRRRTSNDPLGATVRRMPRKTTEPLRTMVTRQRLPTRF